MQKFSSIYDVCESIPGDLSEVPDGSSANDWPEPAGGSAARSDGSVAGTGGLAVAWSAAVVTASVPRVPGVGASLRCRSGRSQGGSCAGAGLTGSASPTSAPVLCRRCNPVEKIKVLMVKYK